MRATMYGCEIVWSAPIGSAASRMRARETPPARRARAGREPSPRARARRRCRARGAGARPFARAVRRHARALHVRRQARHRSARAPRHHVGDARRRRVDADGEDRRDRVALDERAVAAAARVVAAAEVGELPALGRGHEQLACVRIGERGPARCNASGWSRIEMSPLSPSPRRRAEAELLAFAPGDGFVALEPKRHLDRSSPSSARASPAASTRASGEQIDLPGAVRRGDDDVVRKRRERQLELRGPLDRRLPVVGEEDHGVALEERVRRRRPRRAAPGSRRRCARARRPRRRAGRARATRSRSRRGSTRGSRSRPG